MQEKFSHDIYILRLDPSMNSDAFHPGLDIFSATAPQSFWLLSLLCLVLVFLVYFDCETSDTKLGTKITLRSILLQLTALFLLFFRMDELLFYLLQFFVFFFD